ncbi:MAG: hypothetical protein Tsb0013_14280 [Phycisphaerales bacterium]
MRIEPLLAPERVVVLTDASDRDDVLRGLARIAATGLPERGEEELFEALLEREKRYPTSTPEGVAFPHAMLDGVDATVLVAAAVRPAVDFRPGEHPAVDLAFAMIGSVAEPFQHVQLLARLARVCRGSGALDSFRAAKDAQSLFEALVEEDRAHG